MKLIIRHFLAGWDRDAAFALGISISAGRRLDTRLTAAPLITGCHFAVGYLFGQTHVWIGRETSRRTEPALKFLQLKRIT